MCGVVCEVVWCVVWCGVCGVRCGMVCDKIKQNQKGETIMRQLADFMHFLLIKRVFS